MAAFAGPKPPLRQLAMLVFIAGFASTSLCGCGKDLIGKTVPVEGKITLDGKPLPPKGVTNMVIFHSDQGNPSRHEPRGWIDSEGNYKMMTALAKRGKEGVPPGRYKVSVVVVAADPRDPWGAPIYLIPRKYANPATSGLTLEAVETPAPGAYDLNLTAK